MKTKDKELLTFFAIGILASFTANHLYTTWREKKLAVKQKIL